MKIVRFLVLFVFLTSACAQPAASPTTVPASAPSAPTVLVTASPAPTSAVPTVPAAVAVEIPVKGAALLVLDLTTAACTPRPTCLASPPHVAALSKNARDAH